MTKPNFCPQCGTEISVESIIAVTSFGDESKSIDVNGWDVACVGCGWNGVILPEEEDMENIQDFVEKTSSYLRKTSKKHPYEEYETHPLWNVVAQRIEELAENNDIVERTPREYIVGSICKAILK